VEEDEARRVRGAVRAVEVLRVEGTTESVGGENVHPSVAHKRRRCSHRVEHALHARPHLLLRRPTTCPRYSVRTTREVEEMRALGLIELKRPRERCQNCLGDPARVATLETRVVVDADPGEKRNLFPAESWNASVTSIGAQTRLVRRDLRSPGGQELTDLAPRVHGMRVTPRRRR